MCRVSSCSGGRVGDCGGGLYGYDDGVVERVYAAMVW